MLITHLRLEYSHARRRKAIGKRAVAGLWCEGTGGGWVKMLASNGGCKIRLHGEARYRGVAGWASQRSKMSIVMLRGFTAKRGVVIVE